jgi:putative membrane protein
MNDFLLASDAWPQHWWFLFFPLIWLVVVVLVIRFAAMRWGAGCRGRGRDGRPGPERAQGILAERYARGEIGDDEYRTRLDRLRTDAQA